MYRQFFPSALIVFITCIDRFFPRSYAFNSLSLVLYRLLRVTLYLVSEIVYFRFEIVYSRSEIVYSRSEIVILVLKSFWNRLLLSWLLRVCILSVICLLRVQFFLKYFLGMYKTVKFVIIENKHKFLRILWMTHCSAVLVSYVGLTCNWIHLDFFSWRMSKSQS